MFIIPRKLREETTSATKSFSHWNSTVLSCKGLLSSALQRLEQSRYVLPICLLGALIVRLFWIALVPAQPLVIDFQWYYERGRDIALGKGLTVNGVPTAFWPVGYPAFLALLFLFFGPSLLIAKIANIILYLGMLICVYSIAKQLFHSELVARITLLILSFWPNHIAYTSLVASEILFVFLMFLGIALLLRQNNRPSMALMAGVVLGLACLVRTQAILVPALFFLSSLPVSIREKKLTQQTMLCAIVYLAFLLTILPWLIRNEQVFHGFVFISNNGGLVLLAGNNPLATGGDGRIPDHILEPLVSHVANEREMDQRLRSAAIAYITDDPLRIISLLPKKFWYLYNADIEGIKLNEVCLAPLGVKLRNILYIIKGVAQSSYILLVLAFFGCILKYLLQHRWTEERKQLPMMGIYMIMYFTATCLITVGSSRYHFPLIPWFAMYAGALVGSKSGKLP